MKKRRNKKFKSMRFLVILFAIISFIYLYETNSNNDKNNTDNDYSKEALNNINDESLENDITHNLYSRTLDEVLLQDKFNPNHIDVYYGIDYLDKENFVTNINLLADIGYNSDEINTILSKLGDEEVKKLEDSTYTSDLNEYLAFAYFQPEYMNRYLEYKKMYSYDYEKTITYVNINLDYAFYDPAVVKTVTDEEDELILVNKYNKIDADYSPALVTLSNDYATRELQVTNNTKLAFEKLCDSAKEKNLDIKAVSTYRTYNYQKTLYNKYVATDGKTNADTYSARPGHSEHHTGLALDVQGAGIIYNKFATTAEYEWFKANGHLYGFIVRYPEGKTNITGYIYEAWHLRYVGVEVATYIHKNNITFDEYYAQFLIK